MNIFPCGTEKLISRGGSRHSSAFIKMFAASVAAFFAFILFLDWLWRSKLSKFSLFPCPPTLPLIGNLHLLIGRHPTKLAQAFKQWHQDYEFCFVLWLGWKPLLITSVPEHAEVLLRSNHLTKKSAEYSFFKPWLGSGLLISEGDLWQKRRKMLTPAFHFSILNDFTSIFVSNAEKLIQVLQVKADAGDIFNVCPLITRTTLDAISKTAMGVDLNASSSSGNAYAEAIIKMSRLVQLRQIIPLFWNDFLFNLTPYGWKWNSYLNTLHSYPDQIIHRRINELRSGGKQTSGHRKVFLDVLLDSYFQGDIDEEGVRAEVNTFLFEGHDTTAHAISWTLFFLAVNPDIQQKAWKSVIDELSEHDNNLHEAVKHMPYLEAVIKESLRIATPVPLIARELIQPVRLGKVEIPVGTSVIMCPGPGHFNETVWGTNALEFDPERFLNEKKEVSPYAYIPFSAGPRNCIGKRFALLEIKVTLGLILQSFSVACKQTLEECGPYGDQVLRPYFGINLLFTKRV